MTEKLQNVLDNSSKTKQNGVLEEFIKDLRQDQVTWLAGYFAGQADANLKLADVFKNFGNTEKFDKNAVGSIGIPLTGLNGQVAVQNKVLTILYGSHSGNGSGFAKIAKEHAGINGYEVKLVNMNDYRARDLKKEKNLLVIVSTHGEGEPPMAAEDLYEFIHSKRAPRLNNLQYSVLALGDKTYIQFCKTGVDFDTKLEELGAKRIYKRIDCDLNFKTDAKKWLEDSIAAFDNIYGEAKISDGVVVDKIDNEGAKEYSEEEPYRAEMIGKIDLNGRGSNKETLHVEVLTEGSGIKYKPGDSIGIIANNPERLVKEVFDITGFNQDEKIIIAGRKFDLIEALRSHLELTVITPDMVKKHNEYAKSSDIEKLYTDTEAFKQFLYNNDVVDLLLKYPVKYKPQEFVDILRTLPSRLYSISSSPSLYEEELHFTVGVLRYSGNGREKQGCCSTYISDKIGEGDEVSVYIKPNDGFRLPADSNTPIIMVGAGTGIAPYRAFIDERASTGANGKNWLIFGNQYATTDFLYQTEWQKHIKNGVLTRMDVAFSRDQKKKIYVQNKITEASNEIFSWLEQGAAIYVCGDKDKMEKEVQQAFLEVIKKEGGVELEEATNYLKKLKKEGRYQEDVY